MTNKCLSPGFQSHLWLNARCRRLGCGMTLVEAHKKPEKCPGCKTIEYVKPAQLSGEYAAWWEMTCTACGWRGPARESEPEAIAAWNTRKGEGDE